MASVSNNQPNASAWSTIAPYVVPPVAAGGAIVPVFKCMIDKSALQKGLPIPSMPMVEVIKAGLKAAPTVGAIVGTQMIAQGFVEKELEEEGGKPDLSAKLKSSVVVGGVSVPILAIYNGQTMGLGIGQSLRGLSLKQGLAITAQEAAFVAGLSAADPVAEEMKAVLGEGKAVDCTAAFLAGAAGSYAGHGANTALTRWQSGLTVDHPRQLLLGASRKAVGVGAFSVLYKLGKDMLTPES